MGKVLVEIVAYLFGQVAFIVALFYGTNLRIEHGWTFWGGVGIGFACAVVVYVSRKLQGVSGV